MVDKITKTTQPYKRLADWSLARVGSRIALLDIMDRSTAARKDLSDTSNPVVRINFPNGFDPEKHPEDNLTAVREELEFRIRGT